MISRFSKSSVSIFWRSISSSSKETFISLNVGSAFWRILIYFLNRSSENDSFDFVGFNLAAVILTTCIPCIASTILDAKLLFNNAATGRHRASSLTACFLFSKSFNSERKTISLYKEDVLSSNFSVLRYFFVSNSDSIFFSRTENS